MQESPILLRLQDMDAAIQGILETLDGVSFDEYQASWLMRMGVQHAILIVSEASRAIPDDLKTAHPTIPWSAIAAIGNRLRHEYHKIDDRTIWRLTGQPLSELHAVVRAMIEMLERPQQ